MEEPRGRYRIFLLGEGGGGVQTVVQKGLLNFFLRQITSPPHPLHQSRLHVILPWPLTTRSPLAREILLREQRRTHHRKGTQKQLHCWISLEFNLVAAKWQLLTCWAEYKNTGSYSRCPFPFSLLSRFLSPPSPPPPIFALDTQEPPIRPDACLRRKFLHLPDRISIFNWLKKVCDKCLSISISVSVRQTTYNDIFYL